MAIVEGVRLKVAVEGDTVAVKALDRVLQAQVDVEEGAESLEKQSVQTGQKLGEEVSQGAQKAEQSLQDLQQATENTAQETQQFSAVVGDSAPNALSDFRRDVRRTADVAQDSGRKMQRAGGATRGLAMNLSQIAADSPFGFLGISNNLEMLFSSAQRAKSQLGSFGAVARSLMSPGALLTIGAGVVSALAVAFGDDLTNAIFDSTDQLKLFKEELEEVLDFGDVGGDPEKIEEQIATLEEELGRVRELRSAFDAEDSTIAGRLGVSAQATLGDFLVDQGFSDRLRRLLGLESSAESARLQNLAEQKDRLDEVIEREEERLNKLRARLEVARTLEGIGSAFQPEEEGQAPGPTPETPGFLETPTREQQGETALPEFDRPEDSSTDEQLSMLLRIQGEIGKINRMPFLNQASKAERRVQAIVRAIRRAQRAGRQFSRQEINELIEKLGLAEDEAQKVRDALTGDAGDGGDSQNNVNNQIAQSIRLAGQLGETLAEAFQKGEVEANKLLSKVIQIVGSAVSLVNPIAGATISAVGGLVGAFDEGGYTGSGPRQQVAGIVHAGEYVMSKDAVEAAGGPMFFEAMHQMLTSGMSKSDLRQVAGMPPGYQSGGMVRNVTRPAAGGGSGSSAGDSARLQEEIGRLRQDVRRMAERPNVIVVDDRAARDIVTRGDEYASQKNPRRPQ